MHDYVVTEGVLCGFLAAGHIFEFCMALIDSQAQVAFCFLKYPPTRPSPVEVEWSCSGKSRKITDRMVLFVGKSWLILKLLFRHGWQRQCLTLPL